MDDWMGVLLNSDYGMPVIGGTRMIVFTMLLAFVIGHFVGFVYMWTHEAISYSRTFVSALAVLPVLVTIMMMAMAGSMLVAFGLLAVFGVVHFRNVLKDTRDTTFILWSILEGLCVGSMRFSTALCGALGVGAALLYLRLTWFGTRDRYDAILTLRLSGDLITAGAKLKQILRLHASNLVLTNERRATDGGVDITYRMLLRDPARFDELQAAICQMEGFANVSIFLHDDEAEI